MVHLTRTQDGGVQVDIRLPAPLVYLDYGVIGDLAGTEKGEHLRERICTQGTLYLSWAHLIELFSLGQGPTFERIVQYLKSFGPHFIVIDANTDAVVEREVGWSPGRQNPAIDEDFIGYLAANWKEGSDVSLGTLLQTIASQKELFDWIKTRHVSFKNSIKAVVDMQRDRYRKDRAAKKQLDGATYDYQPPFVTSKVRLEFMRECIRTNESFNLSDSVDFLHAVVPISYCHYVVLDKKWARRCKSLDLPKPETATVFSGTDIDKLLKSIQTNPN